MSPAKFLSRIDALPRRTLALAVLAACGALSLAALLLLEWAVGVDKGTTEYDDIARNLAAGLGFVLDPGGVAIVWRPPLYVFLLAAAYRVTPHPEVLVAGIQVAVAALTALLFFVAGEQIFGRRTATLAAPALAAYPLFAINSGRFMPETVFALAVAAAFLLIQRYVRENGGGWPLWCAIGLLLGVGALLKASLQFMAPFLGVWAVLFCRRRIPLRRAALGVSVMIAVMLAVIAPWTWRNLRVTGEPILIDTSGGYTVWVGNRVPTHGLDDDPLTPGQRVEVKRDIARILEVPFDDSFSVAATAWGSNAASKKLYAEALRNMAGDPAGTARLWAVKLYRFWFSYVGERSGAAAGVALLQLALLLPAAAGLGFAWRDRRPVGTLVMFLAYFQALHVLSTANARYTVPILGHVMLLAAYGALRLFRLSEPGRAAS